MKILAWAWVTLTTLIAIAALSDGYFIPALIFLQSALIAAPIEALTSIRQRFGLVGKFRLIAIFVSGFAAMIALGAAIPDTPERRAERAKLERVQAAEEAAAVKRNQDAKDAEKSRIAAKEALAKAKAAEERKSGFHCLSSWDGSHRGIVDALKESLRDPDSFQHVETRITPTDAKGNHMLLMKYRARNGFGGMNIGQLAAIVKDADCSFEIVANDSN